MSAPRGPVRHPLVWRPATAFLNDAPLTDAPLDGEDFGRRCGIHPDMARRYWVLGLIPADRHDDGSLWFSAAQVPTVARLQRLRASLSINYAALGLVCDLLDRITALETALRVRGHTEPVRDRAADHPTSTHPPADSGRPERSERWT